MKLHGKNKIKFVGIDFNKKIPFKAMACLMSLLTSPSLSR